jgi:CDP-diacylglycerol--serine O-phosphatidyltransferase
MGFLSILNTQIGNYEIACYYILIAAAFDSVDGKLARAIGISSNFGKEIDSLADMVSFCLAPSVLVYNLYTQDMPGISGEIIASTPLILGAIRLARFNVDSDEMPSANFIGLPTPINAISIGSLVVFIEHVKAINPEYSQPRLLLPIILALSFLMVTKIKYAKFPLLNLHSGKVNNFRLCGLSLFLVSFGISFAFDQQYRILIGFVSIYILIGLLRYFMIQDELTAQTQES